MGNPIDLDQCGQVLSVKRKNKMSQLFKQVQYELGYSNLSKILQMTEKDTSRYHNVKLKLQIVMCIS